jgi:hypothetical protein
MIATQENDMVGLLIAVAQAAIEANMALGRMPQLERYIFGVKTQTREIMLQIDRTHTVNKFSGGVV